jgi:7,8-dihydropterin-6-yl-methyl-4-(beta-D-ribofuranosyl)aminobenzene 5'-phosphate synthase
VTTDSLRISILVDNQADSGLQTEHGFSLWIETDDRRILFDTGQGIALEPNARTLGIELGQADLLLLSHGHYDHTGGLSSLAEKNSRLHIYAHPAILQARYSIRNNIPKPIQIPRTSRTILDNWPVERIHWVMAPFQISEAIGLTGPIPRDTDFEDTGGPFYLDPEGKIPDPIIDDLALWIRTPEGLIVCVGCCHAGLVNTLNYIIRLSGESRIRAVVGGFHLLYANERRLEETVTTLRALNPLQVVPCHCTGEKALQVLIERLGKSVVQPGYAGMRLSF